MRTTIIAVATAAFCANAFAHAVKRPIGVDDFIEVREPSQISLSPDGGIIAYMLATPSLAKNSYTHDLYIVATDGKSKPRKLVEGESQSGELASLLRQMPAWAPSSDRLVFVVSNGDGGEIRTVRIDTLVTEALVTQEMVGQDYELKAASQTFAFSPDGRWLAFAAQRKKAESKEEKVLHAIAADENWTPADKRFAPVASELFLMELATRKVSKLTHPHVSVEAFGWSPDSARLALTLQTDLSSMAWYMTTDLFVMDIGTRELRPLVVQEGMESDPKWSPDGNWIAFGTQRGQEDWMYGTTLAVVPANGSAKPRLIGERELDRLSGGTSVPLRWTDDGKFIDVAAAHDLGRHVFRVRVADGATERLTQAAECLYQEVSYSRDGKRVALLVEGVAVAPDIYVSESDKIQPMRLTDSNPQLRELSLPLVERVKWRSPDGKWDLNGLLIKPSSYQQGRRYPMLTNILGGPTMIRQEFNPSFNYALLVMAEREGYAIFMPNSRGRGGYGMDFMHAIRDEKSYVLNPMSDVLSGVDMLVERGIADPERLGVLGFSYGGTLTSYIVTHTNRFRAAIYGEGFPNILGDFHNYRHSASLGLNRDMWGLGNPFEPSEIKRAYDQTAVYRLDKVETPVLIESGEKTNWERDRQLYRGLKYFGVPSEFFIYPRSGHGWDEPLLKQDAFNRHIAWFNYWIKGQPYPDKKKQAEYDAWREKVGARR